MRNYMLLFFVLIDLFILGGLYHLGFLSYILLDTSYISYIIIVLYLLANLNMFLSDIYTENRILERIAAWIPMTLTSLGFLGTVIGIFMALFGLFAGLNFADPASVQLILRQITNGLSVAILTTIAGLSSAIMLSIKYIFHEK